MIGNVMLVTACPECKTTFRITVGILEKAGGQVRCGRCAMIFDANAKLREIDESQVEFRPAGDFKFELQPEPEIDSLAEPFEAADEPDDEPPRADEDEAAAEAQVDLEAKAEAEAEAETESESEAEAEAEAEAATGDASDIAAPERGDAASTPGKAASGTKSALSDREKSADEGDTEPESAAGATTAGHGAEAEVERDGHDAEPDASDTDDDVTAMPEAPDWLAPVDTAPRRTWPWAAATAVAALLLLGQLIHHYRSDLVAVPVLGPALAWTYAGLGAEILPSVDLDQYELRDLTAVAQPSSEEQGWLVIETRVFNEGPKVQPYPYILVRLLDRWEDTIAARYFAPDEYAVTSIRDSSHMTSGSTIDAQFIIMDPGPSATGFELELCARSKRGFKCESDDGK